MRFVFLHGIGNNKSTWDSTLAQPTWQDHHCHAITAPGFGGTTWNAWSLEQFANAVRQSILLTKGNVVLVGHSVGGVVGTLVAEDAPPNLLALVNVEGNLTEHDTTFTSRAAAAPDIAAWLTDFADGRSPQVQHALASCDPLAYQSWARDAVRLSSGMLERYRALKIPTLYVYGKDMHEETMRSLEELAETHSVLRFPNAGHWVMHDVPGPFSEFVTTWARSFDRPFTPDTAPGTDFALPA